MIKSSWSHCGPLILVMTALRATDTDEKPIKERHLCWMGKMFQCEGGFWRGECEGFRVVISWHKQIAQRMSSGDLSNGEMAQKGKIRSISSKR